MFHTFNRIIGALAVCSLLLLQADAASAQPVISLSDNMAMQDISASSLMWIDSAGQSTVEQVIARRSGLIFSPSKAENIYTLGRDGALWQHYRFAAQSASKEHWVLEFPNPLLDRITIYQSSAAGKWTQMTAGDTVPVATWPTPGRYGQFNLDVREGGLHDVYVQIRNVGSISVPVNVVTYSEQTQKLQHEYLVIGIVFGTLLLLVITCIAQNVAYRDYSYGWYAIYSLVLVLMMSAWMGVAGHLLWNRSGTWADLAPGSLGAITGGAILLFVSHICGISARQKWLEPMIFSVGLAAIPVAIAYTMLERGTGVRLVSVYQITTLVLVVTKAISTWMRKDVIGLWVLIGFTPTAGAALLLVSNVMGFVRSSGLTRYGLMIGLAIEVPLLLIAMNMRSRERRSMEARVQAMPTQDALTGLLSGPIFQDRLQQTITRAKRYKEPAAVVYIKLVNYDYIKKTWGVAVAEQSLLRSVIKLRRIVRDVDTVGRVDEALFGLILEGVSKRPAVTGLAARLIAAGLMPLKGLKPEVILQFHSAAVLLDERLDSAVDINHSLIDTLQNMGVRTRRPIRFLEHGLMQSSMGAQSEFEPSTDQTGQA